MMRILSQTSNFMSNEDITSLTCNRYFKPNISITSRTRDLNLGPSMNVSNGVFCTNVGYVLSRRHFRGTDNG